MSLPVELLARADSDLQEVFERYDDLRDGMGADFLSSLDAYLARISVFPRIAPLYFERIRRQVMDQFPYGICYREYTTRITVIAIIDLRQDERQIRRRLRF